MKIAILGDIHGNHLALEACLDSAKEKGVEWLWVTGDLVGYYPFVKEVLDLLAPWDRKMVSGNHEVMLGKALHDPEYLSIITEKYGSSIKIALDTLNSELITQLIALPRVLNINIDETVATLCHGSPVNVDEYIYPDTDLSELEWLDQVNGNLIVSGHTHYPMLREWGGLTFLNPGSVGQPRNKIRKAHWVLFDSTKQTFDFMLEDYDIKTIIDAVKRIDPSNTYLQTVLTR